jgi:hypothetical protein
MNLGGKARRYSCEQVVPIEQEPRHHLVIENEFVRAFAVEIAPHDRTLCHHHPHDYLVYVAGIADIVSARRNEEPETILYQDGECELGKAGMVHVVENLGGTKFRNIVVEFLAKGLDLRRGSEPRPKGAVEPTVWDAGGKVVRVRQRFDDVRTAAVYQVSMQSEAEVEISGPAIVASPYEANLRLEGVGEGVTTIREFSDLGWLSPFSKGLLRNVDNRSARAIVFQLGGRDEQPSAVRTREEPLKHLRAHADEKL